MASNDQLKRAFQALTPKIIKSVNADSACDFLFSKNVISEDDYHKLNEINLRTEKARKLLSVLQTSRHPRAFECFRQAISEAGPYGWLVEEIDEWCSDKRNQMPVKTDSRRLTGSGRTSAQDPRPEEPPGDIVAVHIVEPGDTLFQLAIKYGTTVKKIAECNNIKNPDLIYPSQRLEIYGE